MPSPAIIFMHSFNLNKIVRIHIIHKKINKQYQANVQNIHKCILYMRAMLINIFQVN